VKGLKERLKLIWNFWRGGAVQTRIPIEGGGGMDIFWNNTMPGAHNPPGNA